MNQSTIALRELNSCCNPKRYEGMNFHKANPFDQRPIPGQLNPWCANELILKDPALRCRAKVQPLDVYFDKAVSRNVRPF